MRYPKRIKLIRPSTRRHDQDRMRKHIGKVFDVLETFISGLVEIRMNGQRGIYLERDEYDIIEEYPDWEAMADADRTVETI